MTTTAATIPDQHVRDRIAQVLDRNLLVEAGAGSGKTTALVDRMVALVLSGVEVSQIAAVTFTRKAAADLRQRFQDDVERALRRTDWTPEQRGALDRAVREIDRGFIGTIHAFCARLLRERPLEAGLDPAFEELMEAEHERLLAGFWRAELDRMAVSTHPDLEALLDIGIRPEQLLRAFRDVVDNLDLEFPLTGEPPPDLAALEHARTRLDDLIDRGLEAMPARRHPKGPDKLQVLVQDLDYTRRIVGWDDPVNFLGVLQERVGRGKIVATQYKWGDTKLEKHRARDLAADFTEFFSEPDVVELYHSWLAHRYDPVVRFVRGAALRFERERLGNGQLSFQDLLTVTARLLRTQPRARADLGARYSRLLIDEFQDTDPIQAEIAFLLASDPDADLEGDPADWRKARLRPGALFVVGDPKQSIYRFRRADIQVYNAVRDLIERDGEVLVLNSNFRSLLPIAGMVNTVFSDRFEDEPDDYQAAHQPMLPQRTAADAPGVGVFTYSMPEGTRHWTADEAEQEAGLLAGWIAGRVARGERRPSDFMILTDRKKHLAAYGRALESAGVPVEITGAAVDAERGLDELLIALEALADPANPVLTVATLTGLFFGLDHDDLVSHRLNGGSFDCRRPGDAAGPARDALDTLHAWYERSRRLPADIFVAHFVRDVGLVQDAAANDLGRLRTGVLLYALDAVRAVAAAGDTSLTGAIEALRTSTSWTDAETPMEPGRSDAVRILNVHKAKGLEAPVVVLATPGGERYVPASFHVERSEDGSAQAFVEISVGGGRVWRPAARPRAWPQFEEREKRHSMAERDRIRYVAATRAGDELVVATRAGGRDHSPWGLFEEWLSEEAVQLVFENTALDPVPPLRDGAGVSAAAADVERDRRGRATPTYALESVTSRSKGVGAEPPVAPVAPGLPSRWSGPRGYEWGMVVHATLSAAAAGVADDELSDRARALLIAHGRPVDESGAPRELDTLLSLVRRVSQSDLWTRARAGEAMLSEIPFALPETDGSVPSVLEGVVDLAFREDGAWVIVDFKTDVGDDPAFPERRLAYRAQVDLYAEAWERLTGESVQERVLFFTTLDQLESW